MSPADIQYGRKIVDALDDLGNSRTIRTLAKESGVTLAGVIDEWIDWQERQPVLESGGHQVTPFILAFCDERGIPTDFYRASASLEFGG